MTPHPELDRARRARRVCAEVARGRHRIMETMAERSLDGTVDLDYAPSGLTVAIDLASSERVAAQGRQQISGLKGREPSSRP